MEKSVPRSRGEPDPVALFVARSVPDLIDCRRFGWRQAVRRSWRFGLATNVGACVEVAGVRGSSMMPSVAPSVASQAVTAALCTAASLGGGMAPCGVSPASSYMDGDLAPHLRGL